MFPPVVGTEAELARLEEFGAGFVAMINSGEQGPAESLASIDEYEAANGEVLDALFIVSVEGFAVIEVRLADRVDVWFVAFNQQGGVDASHYTALDAQLSLDKTLNIRGLNRWFVYQEDGGFGPFRPISEDQPVRIVPTSEGIEIETPDGTITATRVERGV